MSDATESPGEEYFNGEWLHEASAPETIMEVSCKHNNFLVWYQLSLKSLAPLNEEDVRCALTHLYRNVPNLSMCYGHRDGVLWMRRASNPEVDFEVLRGLRAEEVRDTLRSYRYKVETGPLFCARLLLESPDGIDDTDDVDPALPNTAYLFFGYHHGITDGTSNVRTMGSFLTLLNDVIAKKPIREGQLGFFVSPEETMKFVMEKKAEIEGDPQRQLELGKELEFNSEQKPMFVYNFHCSGEARTASLIKILDQESTSKFIRRCKQEQVTVNSAIAAVANRSVVDLLVEDGVVQDSYRIQHFHAVNVRRYWKIKAPDALGCHLGTPIEAYTETPREFGGDFWNYTRALHKSLKADIEGGKCAIVYAFALMFSDSPPYSEEYFLSDKNFRGDYGISNMGDVTPFVTEGGDHVRVTHLIRGSTIHLSDEAVLISCQSFRGKFTMCLDYNIGAFRTEVAEKFLSRIFMYLKDS